VWHRNCCLSTAVFGESHHQPSVISLTFNFGLELSQHSADHIRRRRLQILNSSVVDWEPHAKIMDSLLQSLRSLIVMPTPRRGNRECWWRWGAMIAAITWTYSIATFPQVRHNRSRVVRVVMTWRNKRGHNHIPHLWMRSTQTCICPVIHWIPMTKAFQVGHVGASRDV